MVCPVWRVTGREAHTARGRLHLLDRLTPATATEAYAEILSMCLLCGACGAACPRGLDPAASLRAAREQLSRNAGNQPALRILAQKLLASPALLTLLATFGLPLLRKLPADSGMRLRLGLGGAPLQDLQTDLPSPTTDKASVASFHGCYATHLRPDISTAIHRVVTHTTGKPPLSLPSQCCCGLAAEANGNSSTAIRLAKHNIAAFSGNNLPIVVACASCWHQLARYPQLLAEEPEWRERAECFADRLVEFSSFAAKTLHEPLPSRPSDRTVRRQVVCHDPCHLRFPVQATAPQREVVQALPDVTLVELPDGPRCCGQGGLFHLAHPALSAAIRAPLLDQLRMTGAQQVTTTCSGCLIHLEQGQATQPEDTPSPIHLALLLAEYL